MTASFTRPIEAFVRNAPLADVQAVLAAQFLPTDSFRIPFTVTFVQTPTKLVAFDSGNGITPPNATNGKMIGNMAAAGIDPAKVDAVILSHFHGDHVNGLLGADNAAAFPNAEIFLPEAEIAWFGDTANESRSPEGQRGQFRQQRPPPRALCRQDHAASRPAPSRCPASPPSMPSAIPRAIPSTGSPTAAPRRSSWPT